MLKRNQRISKTLFATLLKGKQYHAPHLSVTVQKLPHIEPSRYAVVVSKKIEKRATKRNWLRRRLYMIMKPHYGAVPEGFGVIMTAKKGVYGVSKADLILECESLFKKAFI